MTTMDAVRGKLLELGVAEHLITQNAHLVSDLQLDSTEAVELSLELKRRFGVAVRLESKADLTLGAVCELTDHARAATVHE